METCVRSPWEICSNKCVWLTNGRAYIHRGLLSYRTEYTRGRGLLSACMENDTVTGWTIKTHGPYEHIYWSNIFPQPPTFNSRCSEKNKYLTIRHVMEIVFHVMCLTCQLRNMTAISVYYCAPIPLAARSKAWVCSHLVCWDCGFVSRRRNVCLSCELSSKGLCDGPITRPEVSYRM